MLTNKIINPLTGRLIIVNGPTYKELIKNGYDLSSEKKVKGKKPQKQYSDTPNHEIDDILEMPRGKINIKGNKTRGWGDVAPKRGRERKTLHNKCGDKCFLRPESLSFPICPRNECEIDCRGVSSAHIRAAQWKYKNIRDMAIVIKDKKCVL